jgi:hypothetical protein
MWKGKQVHAISMDWSAVPALQNDGFDSKSFHYSLSSSLIRHILILLHSRKVIEAALQKTQNPIAHTSTVP